MRKWAGTTGNVGGGVEVRGWGEEVEGERVARVLVLKK